MKRGKENEPLARYKFKLKTGLQVREITLCYFDEKRRYASSPDGLIDPLEGLEIKDAKPEIQVRRLRKGWDWKSDHFVQVQGNLLCTARKKWYLVSHCLGLDLIIIEVPRDDAYCSKLKVALDDFCDELDREYKLFLKKVSQ